jgi:hypothetical protein
VIFCLPVILFIFISKMKTMCGQCSSMAVSQHLPDREPSPAASFGGGILLAAAAGLSVGYALTFAWMCANHVWLFDPAGRPPPMDFTEFWSAGKLALQGHALTAYDPRLIHAAEVATVGHPFSTFIGWFYPPLFFFVTAGLASLSPSTAFVAWTSVNLALHAAVMAAIVRRWPVFFIATAAPWCMLCNTIGQDGLLTSAIIGGVLLTLPRHQIASGILLGVLAYKPQFGVLFPIALAFGGYWRAFVSAALSLVLLTILSAAVFGFVTLPAFFHGVASAAATHLVTNTVGVWFALQSVYGFARCLGLSYPFAMGLQLASGAFCAVGMAWLWRSKVISFRIKAAALCVATLLVTPYAWIYDTPILSIAIAFLYRDRPLDRIEWCGVLGAMFFVATYPFIRTSPLLGGSYPVGLAAGAMIGSLVLRRLLAARADLWNSERGEFASPIWRALST